MTVELIIRDGNQEIWRQTLQPGNYRLGRISDNDLVVVSSHLSRHHLQINVAEGRITVTDLGSTNGTLLRGRTLTPNTPVEWPPQESLQIGPLSIQQNTPQAEEAPAPPPPEAIPDSEIVAHITCREAQPPPFTLGQGAGTVRSGVCW